ncbi:MAG: 50S ribosomal protein L6 [Gammaproteobacteria bacterium]|nr:50S ribosomal protein L6 [Gammaproteobacteria bacterium]
MAITSRVGRKPIALPTGVDVKVNGPDLQIKGPKGQMNFPIHSTLSVAVEGQLLTIKPSATKAYSRTGSGSKLNNSIAGTTRARIANLIQGVTKGFERKLILVGVGYRAQMKGTELHLTLGFSHPVSFKAPAGITIEAPTLTEITIKGVDKHLVGHVASCIRAIRSPEPYKGKGVRYADEKIELKETKKK